MRLLLYDDSNTSSDSVPNETLPKKDIISGTDEELFRDDYDFVNSAPDEDDRSDLMEKAKKNSSYSKSRAGDALAKKFGAAVGNEEMFNDDSEAGHKKSKEALADKAREKAKEQIGNRISDEGVKEGFEKGLGKGAKSVAKEGAKEGVEAGAKVAAEAGAKVGARVGTEAAVAGLEGAVDVAAAATGVETLGIGFLVGFLLNIAISLGVSDAVESGFALKDGDTGHALFLANRAAAKIGVFIYLLVTLIAIVSIGGIFIGVPLLVLLNLYMIAGYAFKKRGLLQGMKVWWMVAIVAVVDIFAFLILVAFLGALGYYLCGQGSVNNTIIGAIATIYDWWNKTSAGSVAAEFCKYTNGASTAAVPAP
jgi:hypothetical protein